MVKGVILADYSPFQDYVGDLLLVYLHLLGEDNLHLYHRYKYTEFSNS